MSPASQDCWVKCIVSQGGLRAVAVDATNLISDLRQRHGLSALATQGLGEAVIGALLVASYCKQRERVNLNIQGDGAFSQALVDAYPNGTVRGYIIERKKPHQANREQGLWGSGLLSILRTKEAEDRPYIGTVPLLTGHLAKDLTFYWFQSEQISSAVGLGVYVEKDRVAAAGGFLVQAMPGAEDEEVRLIQRHIQNLPDLKKILLKHKHPTHLLSVLFKDSKFSLVEEKPIQFNCTCSLERVERSLALLGIVELSSILREDGRAVVKCDFCSKEYTVEAPALARIMKKVGE